MVDNQPTGRADKPGGEASQNANASLRSRLPAIVFTLSLVAGLIVIMLLSIPSGPAPLLVGDVAKQNIRAPQRVTYVSQIKTRQARDAAAAAIADVYDYDPGVAQQQRTQGQVLFTGIANLRADTTISPDQKRDRIQRLADGIVSPATARAILAVEDVRWPVVVTESMRILDEVMRDRIRQADLPAIRQKLSSRLNPDLSKDQADVAVMIVGDLLKPNEIYNPTETSKQKREAQDKIEPVRDSIEKGEIIVREGNVISALDLEKLESVGLQQARSEWPDIVSALLLIIVLVGALTRYIMSFQPAILHGDQRAVLLAAGILLSALAARLASSERAVEGVTWIYMVPFAALAMLIGMLIDQQLAIVVAVVVGILAGFTSGRMLDIAAMIILGSWVGALRARHIERLSEFLWAGIVVSLTNVAVVLVFFLRAPDLDTTAIVAGILLALASGGLAAAITAITFGPLGNVLGAPTVLHLLELAHPSQPLFRRLLLEASGTYHHSVVIGTLAERAAQAIGADSMLVRVGAYYHDIGKIVRPYLFIENQINGHNIHDTLDPKTSAKAVMSHVTDGLDLARKHRLPKPIQDMIPQHHGTKMVGYFYARARAQYGDVDENEFRYPGPKPQNKEAGILMLADGIEAAVRASRDHSQEIIERIVCDIVDAHIADGQLSECPLTLKDLDLVRRAFGDALQGVYHPRVAYPPLGGERQALPTATTPAPVASIAPATAAPVAAHADPKRDA